MYRLSLMTKYSLFVLNVIIVVGGICLIISGSIMLSFLDGDASHVKSIPTDLIIVGSIILIVSFVGCCGTIMENITLITMYGFCLFVLVFVQTVLVVCIVSKEEKFLINMGKLTENAWIENDRVHGYPMDFLQMSFNCCGLYNFTDYHEKNVEVQFSCCGGFSSEGECPEQIYRTKPGCRKTFLDFWHRNINAIRYAGIGLLFLELSLLAMASYLTSTLKKLHFWYYGQKPFYLMGLCWSKLLPTSAPISFRRSR